MKKVLEPKFEPIESKQDTNLDFLPFSQAWFISFSLICLGWKLGRVSTC